MGDLEAWISLINFLMAISGKANKYDKYKLVCTCNNIFMITKLYWPHCNIIIWNQINKFVK